MLWMHVGGENPKLGVKAENWNEIRFNFFFFCTFSFSLGTLGVLFGHTFGTFVLPFFWADLNGEFLGL
jgi:hypothetical protein